METKNFKDYKIADISSDDQSDISELERTISSKSNKDVILIAYQSKDKTEG